MTRQVISYYVYYDTLKAPIQYNTWIERERLYDETLGRWLNTFGV